MQCVDVEELRSCMILQPSTSVFNVQLFSVGHNFVFVPLRRAMGRRVSLSSCNFVANCVFRFLSRDGSRFAAFIYVVMLARMILQSCAFSIYFFECITVSSPTDCLFVELIVWLIALVFPCKTLLRIVFVRFFRVMARVLLLLSPDYRLCDSTILHASWPADALCSISDFTAFLFDYSVAHSISLPRKILLLIVFVHFFRVMARVLMPLCRDARSRDSTILWVLSLPGRCPLYLRQLFLFFFGVCVRGCGVGECGYMWRGSYYQFALVKFLFELCLWVSCT